MCCKKPVVIVDCTDCNWSKKARPRHIYTGKDKAESLQISEIPGAAEVLRNLQRHITGFRKFWDKVHQIQ